MIEQLEEDAHRPGAPQAKADALCGPVKCAEILNAPGQKNLDRLEDRVCLANDISAASGTGVTHSAAQILQAFLAKSAEVEMCSASSRKLQR